MLGVVKRSFLRKIPMVFRQSQKRSKSIPEQVGQLGMGHGNHLPVFGGLDGETKYRRQHALGMAVEIGRGHCGWIDAEDPRVEHSRDHLHPALPLV